MASTSAGCRRRARTTSRRPITTRKDGWLDEAVKSRPFGRLIDPKEVARACAYLCSDELGLMTGSNIDFDQNVVGTGDPPLEP